MRTAGDPGRRRAGGEEGHLLILLMAGITVMLIMMTAAAQSWTFTMRRERELELIFRGEQYVLGLNLYRKVNGNAFPVGDLKVLGQKNPTGVRFMRKLYKNPMDPNGRWQYLYLHPGGTGFINPCAVGGAAGFNDPSGRNRPVQGFGLTGTMGGAGLDRGRNGDSRITGFGSEDDDSSLPTGRNASQLSAIDPKTFKETGIQKMNLPIVGVVNCQMEESIRIYKGQTWLSNWAFTPLAQGEFGGNAQGGGGAPAAQFQRGLGSSGSEVFRPGSKELERYNGVRGAGNNDNPWQRSGATPPPPPSDDSYDEDDDSYDEDEEEEDPNAVVDPNLPPDPNAAHDPNHRG